MDFDALVNAKVNETFGELALTGNACTYTPQGGTAFALDGVFDLAWREAAIHTGRHSAAMAVSTTRPAFGCRLSDFPAGVAPRQGDTLVRLTPLLGEDGTPLTDEQGNPLFDEQQYEVSDIRPDGITGWIHLILN
jgi:hypothetical protein